MTDWTKERHEAARARCDAATDGPWLELSRWLYRQHMNAGDRNFILNSRTDLPDALDEIKRLSDLVLDADILNDKQALEIERLQELLMPTRFKGDSVLDD